MARPVLRTKLCDMLGIEYPILSAGMGPSLIGETTGAPVELVVTMGRARPFLAHGRIRHHSLLGEGPHFGVEFTRIRPEDRQRLARYVQMRLALGAVAS